MRCRIKLSHIAGALLICVSLAQAAFADMTYIQEQKDFSRGQAGKPRTLTTYITPTKMKTDEFLPETSSHKITIFDLERMKVLTSNSKTKKYSETDLNLWVEGSKMMPKELQEFKAKITVTKETARIQDYACTKVVADMGVIKQTSWATSAIKTDTAVFEFYSRWAEAFKDAPFITNRNAVWRQYRKMNSFPVRTVIDVKSLIYNAKIELNLKSHNYDKIDPSVFDVPKGYTPLPTLKLPPKTDTASDTK